MLNCRNPYDLQWKLNVQKAESSSPKITPYYEGFKGTITKICDIKDAMDSSKIYKKYWTNNFKWALYEKL